MKLIRKTFAYIAVSACGWACTDGVAKANNFEHNTDQGVLISEQTTSIPSGVIASWENFTLVVNGEAKVYFRIYFSRKDTPPPKIQDWCSITYHTQNTAGPLAFGVNEVRNANIVDSMTCKSKTN